MSIANLSNPNNYHDFDIICNTITAATFDVDTITALTINTDDVSTVGLNIRAPPTINNSDMNFSRKKFS